MKRVPIYGILTCFAAFTFGLLVDMTWPAFVVGCVVCLMAGVGSGTLDTRRAGGGPC